MRMLRQNSSYSHCTFELQYDLEKLVHCPLPMKDTPYLDCLLDQYKKYRLHKERKKTNRNQASRWDWNSDEKMKRRRKMYDCFCQQKGPTKGEKYYKYHQRYHHKSLWFDLIWCDVMWCDVRFGKSISLIIHEKYCVLEKENTYERTWHTAFSDHFVWLLKEVADNRASRIVWVRFVQLFPTTHRSWFWTTLNLSNYKTRVHKKWLYYHINYPSTPPFFSWASHCLICCGFLTFPLLSIVSNGIITKINRTMSIVVECCCRWRR